ncbi:alpha/beta hydrolase [Allomuricauda sp. NBRC 101325]|uniref:alpha/beta hydrolase n=1 Tax=Allomuricauda sp. NBRC 101325 TaxID=1113758 RepID=UPI002555D79A|nr:alpha/beta hydrolase [Muricauda sp. NBRC 101325]
MRYLIVTFALFFGVALSAQDTIYLKSIPTPKALNVYQGGERSQTSEWDGLKTVSNVSQPSLTVYLPDASKAIGTALIIAPGGGFHTLSMDNEGRHLAEWCVEHGIAAFVLKYRLVPTGENPGQEFMENFQKKGQEQFDKDIAPYIELAKSDGMEAIAHVRANALKYQVDPSKIGIIGFSAGGTVAGAAALEFTSEENRPDFAAPIYAAMHVLDLDHVPNHPMPLFMAVTGDDFFGFQEQAIHLFQTYNAAKLPIELHLYEKGQHGFGMKTQNLTSDNWIRAFESWMVSHQFLK